MTGRERNFPSSQRLFQLLFGVFGAASLFSETRGDPGCAPPRTARLPSSSLHRAPRLACAASPLAVSTAPSWLSRTARHGSRSRSPGSRMPRGCAPGSFLRPHPRRGETDAARRRTVGTRGGPGWSGVVPRGWAHVARGWHSMRGGAARRDDCALVDREVAERGGARPPPLLHTPGARLSQLILLRCARVGGGVLVGGDV